MRTFFRPLERHWFAPAPLRDLAFFRITVVAAQLLIFLPSLGTIRRLGGADDRLWYPLPALKVLLWPFGWGVRPDPMLLEGVLYLTVVAGILGLIGLYTRPSLLAFTAGNTVLIAHTYSYGEYHHNDGVMVIALAILSVSACGRAWSIDSVRSRIAATAHGMRFVPSGETAQVSEAARWPLRLVQWLLVLIYLSAGLSKLAIGGLDWLNGYTLAYYLAEDGLRWDLDLGLKLAAHPKLLVAMSVVAITFELSFALAILFPRLTWAYVLLGTGLHVGIDVLQHARFFQFIALYAAFVEPLRAGLPASLRPRGHAHPKWRVVYDGLCPLCLRTMVLLDAMDFRKRLAFVDLEHDWPEAQRALDGVTQDQARHAMHVAAPDGSVCRGFFAFRALARLLPPLWPIMPLLHAPMAASIGPRLYDLTANNRGRTACRVETCQI